MLPILFDMQLARRGNLVQSCDNIDDRYIPRREEMTMSFPVGNFEALRWIVPVAPQKVNLSMK